MALTILLRVHLKTEWSIGSNGFDIHAIVMYETHSCSVSLLGEFRGLATGIPFYEIVGTCPDDASRITMNIHLVTSDGDNVGFGPDLFIRHDGSGYKVFAILLTDTKIDAFCMKILNAKFDGIPFFEFTCYLNVLTINLSELHIEPLLLPQVYRNVILIVDL